MMNKLILASVFTLFVFVSPSLAQDREAGLVKANTGDAATYRRGIRTSSRKRRPPVRDDKYDFEKAPGRGSATDGALGTIRRDFTIIKQEMNVLDRPSRFALADPSGRINDALPKLDQPDPMVAVGDKTILLSNTTEIKFFDKGSARLLDEMTATDLFWRFLSPTILAGPDIGKPNPEFASNFYNVPADIPYYCSKARACKEGGPRDPVTGRVLPCNDRTNDGLILDGYDVRVLYQKEHKRFVIVAALKNYSSRDNDDYNNPPTRDCSQYLIRLVGVAVSRSENPLDGFHIYRTTENNYRDWPNATVDQDYLVLAHKGGGEKSEGTSIVTVFSFRQMINGEPLSRWFTIKQITPIGTPHAVIPVANFLTDANSQAFFFLEHANASNGIVQIWYFKKPTNADGIFGDPPDRLKHAGTIVVGGARFGGGAFAGITYFDDNIYTVSYQQFFPLDPPSKRKGYGLNFFRIPVSPKSNGTYEASVVGLEHSVFKDENFSFMNPSLAIDSLKNIVIQFIRLPRNLTSSQKPQIRTKIKFSHKTEWETSKLVKEWAINDPGNESLVHYSWVTKDPFKAWVFWHTHKYQAPGKGMWLGKVDLGTQ